MKIYSKFSLYLILLILGAKQSIYATESPKQSFSIISWNVLNDKYLTQERYPFLKIDEFNRSKRKWVILNQLKSVNADIICLQELDTDSYAFFSSQLKPMYQGAFAQKANSADGLGTFYKIDKLTWMQDTPLLCEGSSSCGKFANQPALFSTFKLPSGRKLSVMNTKIKWQPAAHKQAIDRGWNQVRYLIDKIVANFSDHHWIIVGDFNQTEDHYLIREFQNFGLIDSYALTKKPTCYANGLAKRIDYIWHSKEINATPWPVADINDDSPIPNQEVPSDHLAIGVTFIEAE